MKRFSLLFGAACALAVVFAPVMACADTQAQQQARKYQAVPSSVLLLGQLTAPLSWKPQDLAWKPQDLDGLIKRLRIGIPAITGLPLETKNALIQLLNQRQAVAQAALNNANEELRVAQARRDNHQAQWQTGTVPPEKREQWNEEARGLLMALANAMMAVLNANNNLRENDTLIKKAQSLPVVPAMTFVPAAPSSAPLSSRTLQYTPADADALIKRNPLFTPEDQAKVGIKRLDGAAQDTTGKP